MNDRRANARALIVGMGGLGCPASLVLARAGVGTIGIADSDEVEVSNLHRQILFDERDVGRSKVDRARSALERAAPGIRIEPHQARIRPDNALELFARYDVILEGTDNFPSKFLVADAAALVRVPVVHASAIRWYGVAFAVSGIARPCYRCLFEDLPEGDPPNCAEAGVIGPLVGIIGALQADLALRFLDGASPAGEIVTYDGRRGEFRRRSTKARACCALCGEGRTIQSIDVKRYAWPASGA